MQGSLCLSFFAGMPVPSQAALVVPCVGKGDALRGSATLTYANGAHFTQRRNKERQMPVVGRVVVVVCVLDPGRILGVWPGLRCWDWQLEMEEDPTCMVVTHTNSVAG